MHNHQPMRLAPDQKLWLGKPSIHSRQKDGRSEPLRSRPLSILCWCAVNTLLREKTHGF